MRKKLVKLAGILAVITLLISGGCTNIGPTEAKEYDIIDFTGVKVSAPFEVEITQSDAYGVVITAPEYWFKRIKVEKAGNTLEVGANFNIWTFWRGWGGKVKLQVTMPVLEKLEMSGASSGTVRGFEAAENFKLIISGASHLDIDVEADKTSVTVSGASGLTGDLETQDLRLNISGASSTQLDGTVNELDLEVSGASRASLEDLDTQEAYIELGGASNASVSVEGEMDVELSGASNLEYSGSPVLGMVNISGASTIKQR